MTDDERAVIAAAEGYRDSPTSVAFNALCHAVDGYRANVAREVAEAGVEHVPSRIHEQDQAASLSTKFMHEYAHIRLGATKP